ncbi:hypothetical protein WJU16_18960 [Chitinophaga pollutisoli]|uniref:Uncharacterized protein n=1 Tax=Chitinophaga pollutisoli TaxID=3133966 RepID=A0ABZ2YLR0_9BACT
MNIGGTPELVIVFPQDAGESFQYITSKVLEIDAVKSDYEKWRDNIDQYPIEFEKPERMNGRIIFAAGEDHAAEQILSPASLAATAPRRRHCMIYSYHEDFLTLEYFFHRHFIAWRETNIMK